jgi:hypothetical protein
LPKKQFKLLVRLPEYQSPRNSWGYAIHKAVEEKMKERNVYYTTEDKPESKKRRLLKPIIPNDSQIYRVIAEKCLPPKQSHG